MRGSFPWWSPEENSGWCQNPIVHGRVEAARSARSHCSWGLPTSHPTRAQLELRTTTCQVDPRSKLYQPSPGVPAAAPKYAKYPAAPLVMYSWLPTAGRVMALRRP